MNKFYVGQPVICINDNKHPAFKTITWPVRGRRYIIRAYVLSGGRWPAVALREIRNPDILYLDGMIREAAFWDERFEPATDISELLKLQEMRPLTVADMEEVS